MNREHAAGRGLALAVLALLCAGTLACAHSPRVAYSPHELRAAVAPQIPVERRGSLLVPFQVTPELVARAERYVDGNSSDYHRADALTRAITDEAAFGVEWEPVTTAVAYETAARGGGNCLSLTSLFIGLARGIGLQAFYVDASDRVNDLSRAEELLVDTGHIAATVRTERGWSLVDFTGEISNYRTFRILDDVEALAHFYNNRGYEMIVNSGATDGVAPWERALADFEMAVIVQPDFPRALNNLGVAYSRRGEEQRAEQAYLRAIAADSDFAAPHHNLGNLYSRQDRLAEAIRSYGVAIRRQSKNPYAYFHLGLAQYRAGDIAAAIAAFERAIALKQDYLEPRTLLAQAYRSQGRMEEADRVLRATRGTRQ